MCLRKTDNNFLWSLITIVLPGFFQVVVNQFWTNLFSFVLFPFVQYCNSLKTFWYHFAKSTCTNNTVLGYSFSKYGQKSIMGQTLYLSHTRYVCNANYTLEVYQRCCCKKQTTLNIQIKQHNIFLFTQRISSGPSWLIVTTYTCIYATLKFKFT